MRVPSDGESALTSNAGARCSGMDPRMLSRVIDTAVEAELRAFEAVDRCCAEARRDHLRASSDVDRDRRLSLRAVMTGDVRTGVSHAGREGEAEVARRIAWSTYRESYALLLALVDRTATELGGGSRSLTSLEADARRASAR